MKKLLIAIAIAAVFPALAETAASTSNNTKITPYPASRMDEYNKMTGGLIDPPANAKVLLFLDARAEDVPSLTNLTLAAENQLGVAIDVTKTTLAPDADPQKVAFAAKTGKAGAVIILYERKGAPVLSVFPEDGVALVNVLPLKADDPSRKWYIRRVVTEFWRSVSFALGGYGMPTQIANSMQPIFSLADYDNLRGAGIHPVQVGVIGLSKWKLGITGRKPVPYSRACREGWAPPPTNDAQKVVWEKLKDPTARFKKDFQKANAPVGK